jgi:hypothetical protein
MLTLLLGASKLLLELFARQDDRLKRLRDGHRVPPNPRE